MKRFRLPTLPDWSLFEGRRGRSRRPAARRLLVGSGPLLLLLWLNLLVASAHGRDDEPSQPTYPQATPEELGLKLPDAPPVKVDDRRVLLPVEPTEAQRDSGEGNEPVVGRVYLQVGKEYVVLMPDGRLQSFPIKQTTPTDRPFLPLDKKKLAQRLVNERFPGFKTRVTKRYLYVYNSSDDFQAATSRILETMYPALANYCKKQKIAIHEPEFPLVVIMFHDQQEFQKYRDVPDGMVAYYNSISNHIVMFEQSKLTETAPELAFKQSVSTIAHEGVHQILHNIGVQQRLSRWPIWFSEGVAEYFAPTELDRRVRWKGIGLVNDLRLYELSEFYKAHDYQATDGLLVRQCVEAETLDSLGYATSWAMIHYLARYQRERFGECLQEVSRLGPLESIPPANLFTKHFSQDQVQFEKDLIAHLKSLPYVNPVLNQTHYLLMIVNDGRAIVITSSPVELQRQVAKLDKKDRYQIQTFPDRPRAEIFGQAWLRAQ